MHIWFNCFLLFTYSAITQPSRSETIYRSRSYGFGKPCSNRLSTLLMAATVGWDSEVSLRVSSSLGISWNSLRSFAFFAASLFNTESGIYS